MGAAHSSNLHHSHRINQLFFLGKCTTNEKAESERGFYEFCEDPNFDEYYNASCTKIAESGDDNACSYGLLFRNESFLEEKEVCDLGAKWTLVPQNYTLEEGLFERIKTNCHYWRVGRPYPWWLLLLIILSILIAFAIFAALLWTYWLKKRMYPKVGSTLTSQFTSTPVSSMADSDMASKGAYAHPPPPPLPPPPPSLPPSQQLSRSARLSRSPTSRTSSSQRSRSLPRQTSISRSRNTSTKRASGGYTPPSSARSGSLSSRKKGDI